MGNPNADHNHKIPSLFNPVCIYSIYLRVYTRALRPRMCMSSHPSLILQNACTLHIGVGYTGAVMEATEGVSGGPLFILTYHNVWRTPRLELLSERCDCNQYLEREVSVEGPAVYEEKKYSSHCWVGWRFVIVHCEGGVWFLRRWNCWGEIWIVYQILTVIWEWDSGIFIRWS